MKIQIITNLYPVPWDPNRAAFNRQQFQHLSALCPVRVTVVVPWLERFKNRKIPLIPVTTGNLQISYRSYFYTPLFARFTHAVTLFLSLFFERKRIREFSPDCLLMSWAYPDGVAGAALAKYLGLPALIKIHGSDINMHLLHASRARQILWAMHNAMQIFSVSKALGDKLIDAKVPAQKIRVIYNGIDKQLFRPIPDSTARAQLELSESRKILLYVGNLKQEKGCVDLFEAFATIYQTNQEVDLYYVGSGKEAVTLQRRIDELGLQARVILLGSLAHEKLSLWMNAATIVALPSYNEGVPNVLLEAMACGTPVVATAVGGIPEVVQPHAGILVEPGDLPALANALGQALSMDWKATDIVASVSNFDWDINVRQLYESLESSVTGYRQMRNN